MFESFFIVITELFHIGNARSITNNKEDDNNWEKYDEFHNEQNKVARKPLYYRT